MEHRTFDPLIRRRAILLSMAGALPLLGCGKSKETVPSPAEPFPSTQACTPGEAAQPHFAAVSTHHLPGPYAWTNLVPVSMYERTPLPLMDGSAILSFKGKLWLIGGWWPYPYKVIREVVDGVERIRRHPDGSIHFDQSDFYTQGFIKRTTNAVWCSSDGIIWHNVKPDTYNTDAFNSTTDWAGRHAFGCVVFQNRMWIIGGDTQHIGLDLPSPLTSENYSESSPVIQDASAQNDIWSSADGITWSKEGNLPFVHQDMSMSTRHIHSVLVFNNAMWLIGGLSDNGTTFLNDVWKSTNGKTWTCVLANMPNPPGVEEGSMGRWSPRVTNGHTVVHKNRMWILGGAGYNDVWSSADGVNWRLELANDSSLENVTRWMARSYPQTASFEGKLWIFTGSNALNKTTFRYPHTWDCRQGATPPPGCIDTPDLIGNQRDVWYSTDGKQWMRYNHELVDPRHAAASVVHGNALVVQGGGWNDCWVLSPYVWERVEQNLTMHFGAIQCGQAAVSNVSETDHKAWLLGAGNCIYTNAVWVTSDASNWTLVKDNSYLRGGGLMPIKTGLAVTCSLRCTLTMLCGSWAVSTNTPTIWMMSGALSTVPLGPVSQQV